MLSTSISTRVHAQIAATVSVAIGFPVGFPVARVQTLSLQEMFVLCQQHGFEVDITIEKPAVLQNNEVGFVAELDMAA